MFEGEKQKFLNCGGQQQQQLREIVCKVTRVVLDLFDITPPEFGYLSRVFGFYQYQLRLSVR